MKLILHNVASRALKKAEGNLRENRLFPAFFGTAAAIRAYQQLHLAGEVEDASDFMYKVLDQIASNEAANLLTIGEEVTSENIDDLINKHCGNYSKIKEQASKENSHPVYGEALNYLKQKILGHYSIEEG